MKPLSPLTSHPTFGDKYLVYSSYPNGYPVLNMTEKTAEKVLKKVNPSLAIDRNQYVFGRTQWHNQTVGSVIFPLHEDDSRTIDGILDNPSIDQTEKDVRINQLMPTLFSKDTGETHVYDLSLNEIIQNPDKALLKGDAAPPNEKVSLVRAAIVASPVKASQSILPGSQTATAAIAVALPKTLEQAQPSRMPSEPIAPPDSHALQLNPVAQSTATQVDQHPLAQESAFKATLPVQTLSVSEVSVWQWPPPKAPNFWAQHKTAPTLRHPS